MKERRNLGGRPRREPDPGERVKLGLRVTPEMKARLDAAAERNGRSQSQEAELRLERSFERDDMLPQLLRTAFGSITAGHLLAIGFLMTNAGLREYWSRHSDDLAGEHNWPNDPTAFDQAVQSALTWLNAAKPAGAVLESSVSPGVKFAKNMIESLQHAALAPPQNDALGHHLAAIRALLGPIVERMAAAGAHEIADPNTRTQQATLAGILQDRLVPILTVEQAMEVAAFGWEPSKWGRAANVAFAHSATGPRTFALEVFSSDETETFKIGDLLILDPDESPADGDWVLARLDHQPRLAQYRIGEQQDGHLAPAEHKKWKKLIAERERLLKEAEIPQADVASVAERYLSICNALNSMEGEDVFFTNNLTHKHIVKRMPSKYCPNICAVVKERTRTQSIAQPDTLADLRNRISMHSAKSA